MELRRKSKLSYTKTLYLPATSYKCLDFLKVWILGNMNSIRNRAEEIVLHELVYTL